MAVCHRCEKLCSRASCFRAAGGIAFEAFYCSFGYAFRESVSMKIYHEKTPVNKNHWNYGENLRKSFDICGFAAGDPIISAIIISLYNMYVNIFFEMLIFRVRGGMISA